MNVDRAPTGVPAPFLEAGRFCRSVVVDPNGFPRRDKPVEFELDLGKPGLPPVRVVEVDASGRIVDDDVPFQFDGAGTGGSGARGTLVLLMLGKTPAASVRRYRIDFGPGLDEDGWTRGATFARAPRHVRVTDCGEYAGQESYLIETPAARYVYHKRGGGFAGLFDPEGNDWISYKPRGEVGADYNPIAKGAGSAHEFRGMPNTAFPKPGLHPGYEEATTTVVRDGPLKATLFTRTLDGEWECTWDFYPGYATFTMHKHARPYWFLYEGTPGGRFDMRTGYVLRSTGARTTLGESWEEALPEPEWVCFGDETAKRALFLVHHEADGHPDSYWPMNEEMTVFGFGRAGREKGLHMYMDASPSRFTVGFVESGPFDAVRERVEGAFRSLDVRVGPLEPAPRDAQR